MQALYIFLDVFPEAYCELTTTACMSLAYYRKVVYGAQLELLILIVEVSNNLVLIANLAIRISPRLEQ